VPLAGLTQVKRVKPSLRINQVNVCAMGRRYAFATAE
jgi:hypothetical protein